MNKEEVLKLAKLGRLELTDQELEKYSKEMTSILGYVETINSVLGDSDNSNIIESSDMRNVFREDANPIEAGTNTKDIVACAPNTQDDFIKVQKILNNENGSN